MTIPKSLVPLRIVREITVRFFRGVSFQLAVDGSTASWNLTPLISRTVLSGLLTWLMLCDVPQVRGEVYQYAVRAKDVSGREIMAFLWVPPSADRLRGVLLGGQTLMEPEFAEDSLIRQACAAEQLAECSGYRELAVAPWFPFGHSVSSMFATRVVCWKPDRCFGALSFKGGLPMPANDPAASLAGAPMLVIKGQFEEFGPGPSGVLRLEVAP